MGLKRGVPSGSTVEIVLYLSNRLMGAARNDQYIGTLRILNSTRSAIRPAAWAIATVSSVRMHNNFSSKTVDINFIEL